MEKKITIKEISTWIYIIISVLLNVLYIFFYSDDKFIWDEELEEKRKYYFEVFNRTHHHQPKAYIEVNISLRAMD